MAKTFFSNILLKFTLLVLVLILPSFSIAGQAVIQGDPGTSSMTSIKVDDTKESSQLDSSSLLIAEERDEHFCEHHCRRHYEERLQECYDPGHPHHHRCEEWAREREQECLQDCYREHRRW